MSSKGASCCRTYNLDVSPEVTQISRKAPIQQSMSFKTKSNNCEVVKKDEYTSYETSSEIKEADLFKYTLLPETLLHDIRQRRQCCPEKSNNMENSLEDFIKQRYHYTTIKYIADSYYKFHIHENSKDYRENLPTVQEEPFGASKDIFHKRATIRSANGTVRGIKNRVREGIATFLHVNTIGKNYNEKEKGKVVVYTTSIGVIRETYQACLRVKQILRTQLVKFEERDVFMSSEYQAEIKERMNSNKILVPQVFVDGHHVGNVEDIDKLNETGELRKILQPFKSMDVCTTCDICGGYRLLPCQICKGSKKSVHRNHFTREFVALKCMNCDEVGLVRCPVCS